MAAAAGSEPGAGGRERIRSGPAPQGKPQRGITSLAGCSQLERLGGSLIPGWILSSGRINQGDKELLHPSAGASLFHPAGSTKAGPRSGTPLLPPQPPGRSQTLERERGASSGLPPHQLRCRAPQSLGQELLQHDLAGQTLLAARSRWLGKHREKGTPPRAVPSQGSPEGRGLTKPAQNKSIPYLLPKIHGPPGLLGSSLRCWKAFQLVLCSLNLLGSGSLLGFITGPQTKAIPLLLHPYLAVVTFPALYLLFGSSWPCQSVPKAVA